MVTEFIVEFTNYLNQKDFKISAKKIFNFFEMMSDENISFSEREDVISLMKLTFCTSRLEVQNLPEEFDKFVKNNKIYSDISNLKEQKEKNQNEFERKTNDANSKLLNLDISIKQKEQQIKQEMNINTRLFTNSDLKFIEQNIESFKKLKFKNKRTLSFIKNLNSFNDNKDIISDYSDVKSIIDEIIQRSEDALKNNDIETFSLLKGLYDLVIKVNRYLDKQEKAITKVIKEKTKDLQKEKQEIQNELRESQKKQQEEQQKIQKELNDKLNQLSNIQKETSNLIVKENVKHHREEFIGKNSIQLDNDEVKSFIDKDFNQLNEDETNLLFQYIKKNILKFKTKMNRNIFNLDKGKLNMQKIVQYACKTGGLPLNLYYEDKRRSKPKLVLVLDVSGSCSSASEMMLSFMYLLQDVFSGGCKTFAFVNTLYDVSNIMNAENINTSIQNVLNTIPRRGVYSNYYKPLECLWEDYKKEITRDSIVIFMGDARNNSNDSGIEFLKNISRKAKSCYWLNTEKFDKWGYKDSIAFEYSKYCRMYEVINTIELINFIDCKLY